MIDAAALLPAASVAVICTGPAGGWANDKRHGAGVPGDGGARDLQNGRAVNPPLQHHRSVDVDRPGQSLEADGRRGAVHHELAGGGDGAEGPPRGRDRQAVGPVHEGGQAEPHAVTGAGHAADLLPVEADLRRRCRAALDCDRDVPPSEDGRRHHLATTEPVDGGAGRERAPAHPHQSRHDDGDDEPAHPQQARAASTPSPASAAAATRAPAATTAQVAQPPQRGERGDRVERVRGDEVGDLGLSDPPPASRARTDADRRARATERWLSRHSAVGLARLVHVGGPPPPVP